VKSESEIDKAWKTATTKSRGDLNEVIIEEFIDFDFEITLLTVTQQNGPTHFCPPIGHRQERGDYQESWQPAAMREEQLKEAQTMADKVTKSLTGAGIWGVEFFIGKDAVYFSELSPRPHDTGMVTMAHTQTFSEFELHCRTVLGLPIPELKLEKTGASFVVLADRDSQTPPVFEGVEKAISEPGTDLRIFGKPSTRPFRRMAVALANAPLGTSTDEVRAKAKRVAGQVNLKY